MFSCPHSFLQKTEMRNDDHQYFVSLARFPVLWAHGGGEGVIFLDQVVACHAVAKGASNGHLEKGTVFEYTYFRRRSCKEGAVCVEKSEYRRPRGPTIPVSPR